MAMDSKQLMALEEELKKDLDAIARVRRMMVVKEGASAAPDQRQIVLPIKSTPPRPDADDADESEMESATSLVGAIEQLLNYAPDVRWTTQKVLAHLRQSGFPLKAQRPIYSVGQALNKLARREKIRMVRKGSGSEPNIYKGKLSSPESEVGLGGEKPSNFHIAN